MDQGDTTRAQHLEFLGLEVLAVVAVFAYLVGPWRTGEWDPPVFAAAALFGWVFRRRMLPAPRPRRSDPRATVILGLFTAVAGITLWVYGLAVRGHPMRPAVVVVTFVLYLPFAWVQQFLTQRYLVLRLCAPLCRGSDLATALAAAFLFGLCHLPWPPILAVTTIAGFPWTWSYLKTGRIWDIALSQAVLATSLFCVAWGFDPVGPLVGWMGR